MKQYSSSKEHFEKGTTLLNCCPNIGAVLKGITKWLEQNGYITYATRVRIDKDANTLKGFYLVWQHLENYYRKVNENNVIPTPQGNIFCIGEGWSKVALCMEITKEEYTGKHKLELVPNHGRTTRFVLKFNKEPLRAANLETFGNSANIHDCEQQLAGEVAMWEKVKGTEDEKYFLPIWKHYKRYNAVLCMYAEHIDSIGRNCEYSHDNIEEFRTVTRKYGIERDIFNGNSGNTGIYQGRTVMIDYGLA